MRGLTALDMGSSFRLMTARDGASLSVVTRRGRPV
jgi:hypothetical protein